MKIVYINSVNYSSTGNVMIGISEKAENQGFETIICVPESRDNSVKQVKNQLLIGNRISRNIHRQIGMLTGFHECFSFMSTYRFLRKLDEIQPDIIHLHNLHGDYLNLPLLFRYFKRKNIPIVWTLHDCWAMTGLCPYFIIAKCNKWITGCHDCPQLKEYPSSKMDRTNWMWKKKKEWFTGVNNLTITTPSRWLGDIVGQSYLKDYPRRVIYNGIDLDVFKPTASNFRVKYHLEGKYIVLGVAAAWGARKGFDAFIQLAERLDDNYRIFLVGATGRSELPENIVSLQFTRNQKELAEIYTAADVFVNPTREEVLGLVNLEALACGTPVITFDTGGSPECRDDTCGVVVAVDDLDKLKSEIERTCKQHPYKEKDCIRRAREFNRDDLYNDYLSLYKEIVKN